MMHRGEQNKDVKHKKLLNELRHEISKNVVCVTSKASDQPAHAQSDQSHCWSLDYSMMVKLLIEHHLEFLSLKGGCTGSSVYTCQKATLLEITSHGSNIL